MSIEQKSQDPVQPTKSSTLSTVSQPEDPTVKLLTPLKSADPNQAPLDQDGKKELYTLRDLKENTGFPDINGLRARINHARKKDPSLTIAYTKGGPRSNRIMVMPKDTFEKLAATIRPKKPTEEKTRDTENQKLVASQEETPPTKKVGPFDYEQDIRPILGKSEEEIKEKLSIEATAIILSHLASDCIDSLTQDPRELLENRLPQYFKTRLDSIISKPPGQFLVDSFVKVLKALWNKDANHTDSVQQRRILDCCFKLKEKDYNITSIIDVVYNHFSIPNPFTSSVVTNAQ